MRKYIIAGLAILVFRGLPMAWTIPKSQNNYAPVNLDMVGGVATMVHFSTVAVLANGTSGWVLALWLSSGADTQNAYLRDFGVLNTTSSLFLPPIQFATVPQIIEFANPPKFTNGLSVNVDTFAVSVAVITLAENDTYQYLLPASGNNIPAQDSALIGMSVRNVYETTTAAFVSTGPVLLYGFYRSTGATSNYVAFRDTGTANTTSRLALPQIAYQATQTFTLANNFYSLMYPVRFMNGISVNTGEAVDRLSVFFRRSKQKR